MDGGRNAVESVVLVCAFGANVVFADPDDSGRKETMGKGSTIETIEVASIDRSFLGRVDVKVFYYRRIDCGKV
jgi:hypothetical protein